MSASRVKVSQSKNQRNSNIELLRIIAMWLILAHHLTVHNVDPIAVVPGAASRAFLSICFYPVGRIGVGIFVAITAWFLCLKPDSLSMKSSLRKIWVLDRQLIFYSVILTVLFSLVTSSQFPSVKSFVLSFFPLLTGVWWFPTTYALYLLFAPFFIKGLRALSKAEHAALSAALIICFGILGFVPYVAIDSVSVSLLAEFFMITVLISFIQWRIPSADIIDHKRMLVGAMLAAIAVLTLCYFLSTAGIRFLSSTASSFYNSVFEHPCSVISLAVSIPLVLLSTSAKPYYSQVINRLARCAFGVYLLTDNAPVRSILWRGPLSFGSLAHLAPTFVFCIAATCIVYLCASLIDEARSLIFSATVDRHPGRLFDRIYRALLG